MTAHGEVNGRYEPVVQLRLRGPLGVEIHVSAFVDTGFSGSLSLPTALVTSERLELRTTGRAKMGDGTPREFNVYLVDIWWDGGWLTVSAAEIGRETLLGMRLIANHRLTIDAFPGGSIDIRPASP